MTSSVDSLHGKRTECVSCSSRFFPFMVLYSRLLYPSSGSNEAEVVESWGFSVVLGWKTSESSIKGESRLAEFSGACWNGGEVKLNGRTSSTVSKSETENGQ